MFSSKPSFSDKLLFFTSTFTIEKIIDCNDVSKLVVILILKLGNLTAPEKYLFSSKPEWMSLQQKFSLLEDYCSLEQDAEEYENIISILNKIKENAALSFNQKLFLAQYKLKFFLNSSTRFLFDRIIQLSTNDIDSIKNHNLSELIDALILKIKELTEPTFKALRDQVKMYKNSCFHYGGQLSPYAAPESRKVIESANKNLEQAQKKYTAAISALENIKVMRAITNNQQEILKMYREEFTGDIKQLFNKILEIAPPSEDVEKSFSPRISRFIG
jgi:DNA-directed RNA polymerase beta' subunit